MTRKSGKEGGSDAVVKINSELLKQVDELISREENHFRFTNKKQFIDLAVYEKLKRELSAKSPLASRSSFREGK